MKRLCLLFTIIAIATTAKAQIGYGPEGSVGYCWFKTLPASSYSVTQHSIMGFRLGGVLDIPMSDNFYFQSGIFWSQKGGIKKDEYVFNSDTAYEHTKETIHINYLEVPLTVLYKTGAQGGNRFFFGLGATIGFMMNGKDKISDQSFFSGQPYEYNATEKLSSHVDVSAMALLGYEFSSGFYVKAYYAAGVSNVSNIPDEIDKNRIVGIGLGYFFRSRKQKDEDGLIIK